MATVNEILELLKELNEVYQQGLPLPSLQVIALAWADDMPDVGRTSLREAIARHRREFAFWPRPAHILRQLEGIRAEDFRRRERERARRALPEPESCVTSRLERNAAKARELLRSLAEGACAQGIRQ